MTRATTREAYEKIRRMLPKRRREVVDHIQANGSSTASEIADAIGRDRAATSCRCGELVKLGVLRELPPRICRVTRSNVVEYELTGNAPRGRITSKKSKTVLVRRCLSCPFNRRQGCHFGSEITLRPNGLPENCPLRESNFLFKAAVP